ncbi:MAG: glycogen debranching N-terminal domain-containing protein, partial [Polyangiaceae bacterium]
MDEPETRDDSAIASGRLLPSDEHDQSKASLDLPSVGDIEQLARANGGVFFVTDRHGDIAPPGARELGLFFKDTRYLSHYRLDVPHAQIVWLSADITSPRYSQVDLMLSDFERRTVLDDPNHFVH